MPISFTSWCITSSTVLSGAKSFISPLLPQRDIIWVLVCKSAWNKLLLIIFIYTNQWITLKDFKQSLQIWYTTTVQYALGW